MELQQAGWPRHLGELDSTERLALWSFRLWVSGSDQWDQVWNAMAGRFGPREARLALQAFARMIAALRGHARRSIEYHQPCCPCLGLDEVCLIAMLAACQTGELGRARSFAAFFVEQRGIAALLEPAIEFAFLLQQRGLALPQRALLARAQLSFAGADAEAAAH